MFVMERQAHATSFVFHRSRSSSFGSIKYACRRLVGLVGRVPDYRAGGRGFKPRPDQHSGSLKITEEKVLPLS